MEDHLLVAVVGGESTTGRTAAVKIIDREQAARARGGRSALAPEKARIAARAEDEVRGADAEGVVAAVADDLGARGARPKTRAITQRGACGSPLKEQGGTVGQRPAAIARPGPLPAPARRASGDSAAPRPRSARGTHRRSPWRPAHFHRPHAPGKESKLSPTGHETDRRLVLECLGAAQG
jgi:hypothetical protein